MKIRKLTKDEVTFKVYATDCEIDPCTCFDTGSEIQDEAMIIDVHKRARVSVWGWANVEVRAFWEGIEGADYLGACSCDDEKDFIENSGYYSDMCEQALSNLNAEIEETLVVINKLEK